MHQMLLFFAANLVLLYSEYPTVSQVRTRLCRNTSNMNPVIHIQNMTKAFAGIRARRMVRILRKHLFADGGAPEKFLALRDINLKISRGDKIALVGNNETGENNFVETDRRALSAQ